MKPNKRLPNEIKISKRKSAFFGGLRKGQNIEYINNDKKRKIFDTVNQRRKSIHTFCYPVSNTFSLSAPSKRSKLNQL